MKKLLLLFFFALFMNTQACQPLTESTADPTSGSFSTATVEGYQPPVFLEDQRMEHLAELQPDLDVFFRERAIANHIPGYVYGIVIDDSLAFSGAYGIVNRDNEVAVDGNSLFRIASMTKSFVSMAIIKLRDEGKLSLHEPAAQYLPELKQLQYLTADVHPITIEQLMTMSAGFPEDNPWADRQLEDSEDEFSAFLSGGMSMSNIPGAAYEYSNLGYAMLGRIITNVSGVAYQQYITEQILYPLGMTDTHWEYEGLPAEQLAIGYRWEKEAWKEEPMLHDGAFGAIGGLITSLNDFSKYVGYHLSAWPPRNDAENGPLKRSSLREMHQMKNPRLYADAQDAGGNPCPSMSAYAYGLGIYEDCTGLRKISHSGGLPGFGSEFQFYPELGIGIISFANRTYAPARSINTELMTWLQERMTLPSRQQLMTSLLESRQAAVVKLIRDWEDSDSAGIIAENFYLDKSRELRKKEADAIWESAGSIQEIEALRPINQLRGTFLIRCEKQDVEVFFSLSPEKEPKVQAVNMRLVESM
jgi:CubicO group peptidase (beta-lactamase class C family)